MSSNRSSASAGRPPALGELKRRCEALSLPLTTPRLSVLEAIVALRGTHPTADEVHAAARKRGSEVGRATVYRALEVFVGKGVLTKASHTGSAVRYDAVVSRHHHLVCLRCDGIIDVADPRLDAVRAPDTSMHGFVVTDVQVQLRGLCRSCQRVKKEDSS